ncbi:hypothetical protein ABIB40_004267 [Pedobacter sp. UYP30]|uniref:hypothetical protein n=1 Tax=Pedobacter sp. UYP30 TaxID=1756400 RepID=UPI0033997C5B
MGFDISYHPIKEKEIQEWYFDILLDNSKIEKLSLDNGIEDFYKQKYSDTIDIGNKTQSTEFFDKTHGYYIAVIQGFYRTYYYTRGSAFSFLIEDKPQYKNYTKGWKDILNFKIDNPINDRITDNYGSGVYISADKVVSLLADYKTDEKIRQELNNFFSDKRIEVFLTALEYCKENNFGLLEATEVVEPNPMEMEESISYSNLFNCDKEGVYLYADAAMEQIREFEQQHNLKSGEISNNSEYLKTKVGDAEKNVKKGFWQKLFGK